MTHAIFYRLAKKFSDLKVRLNQAEMNYEPPVFMQRIFLSSFYMSIGIVFSLFLLLAKAQKGLWFLIPVFVFIFVGMFYYMTKIPDAKIIKISKEIDKEVVFAGKFMIIELKSGVSLYQVLTNIANNYGGIGRYFKQIVQDVDLGTEMEDAINNAILKNPSDNFRKIMWQLSNSIKTGADISVSLNTVLAQISKNQMIEVEKYGKKLNPIATFYLMLAVIIPSLGMVMGVVFASFINFPISFTGFMGIAGFFTFFQFMFYGIIKANRPAVEM